MYTKIKSFIEGSSTQFQNIPAERKTKLNKIRDYISEKHTLQKPASLMFICTHNSRRSHFCQIWATVAANYYGLKNVEIFSGGTEATAFNERAVRVLQQTGFEIKNPGGDNPLYKVRFNENNESIECFSKIYDHTINPSEIFMAIMTCSDADENCPFIEGAEARIAIPYEDPKVADDTPQEEKVYKDRSIEIATEMLYIMSQVKEKK